MSPHEIIKYLYEGMKKSHPLTHGALIQQALQSQHEATWAMAMEAAASYIQARGEKQGVGNDRKSFCKAWSLYIQSLTCPPLQTTNEKCG